MHRTRIKFCGITRPQDGHAAAYAGASAIGLIFYAASTRRVTVPQAKEILAALPPFVTPVGLFVDSSTEEIRKIAGELHLRHLQLHGGEPPEVVANLNEFVVLKSIAVRRNELASTISTWCSAIQSLKLSNLRGLLLETDSKQPGGTGIENDWSTIQAAIAAGEFQNLPPIIAAGGLTPANVTGVIRMLHPWAVDVSSGIESAKGIKSEEKMQQFTAAVRDADNS